MKDISKELHEIYGRRDMRIDVQFDPAWAEQVALITEDYSTTMWFIENTMDGMDFAELSGMFTELFAKFFCPELVDALWRACDRFPRETEEYYIRWHLEWNISYAEENGFPNPYWKDPCTPWN